MSKLIFSVAFGGFYESLHSSNVEGMLDSYFDEEFYNSDCIDYSLIFSEYCIEFVSFLNGYLKDNFHLDSNLEFLNLDSPKEYNFCTDEIIVSISSSDATSIIKQFSSDEDCIAFIDAASESCSGFISFFDGYSEVQKDEVIHLQYIFKYLNSFNEDDFFQYYDFNCIFELLSNLDFIVGDVA